VTRLRQKLKKSGVIKEYTIIPDFTKLGYQLAVITTFKMQEMSSRDREENKKKTIQAEETYPHANLMAVNGIGFGKDVLFITFYKDYSDYSRAMEQLKQIPHTEVYQTQSFIVDLNDERNYRILSMSAIAKHLLTLKRDETT
jgi:DNA-binding Lrp family transcriptional regulator